MPALASHAFRSVRRAVGVLLLCLGLAATTVAATGGRHDTTVSRVLAAARAHLGDRYVWGATGPRQWDCSGLTSVLWRTVGHVRSIPRTAAQQQAWAVPVPVQQVQPGDLVFFGSPVSHVGLVQSRWHGAVVMIDAGSSRHGVIERAVWSGDLVRYGRVPRPGMVPVQPFAPAAATAPVPSRTRPAGHRPRGLAGLPRTAPGPSTRTALHAANLAQRWVGPTRRTDLSFVRSLWRAAGGGDLPPSRRAVARASHRVPLRDARAGDLLLYPSPLHLAVYLGRGLLVDVVHGRVMAHRAWADSGVVVLRLPT